MEGELQFRLGAMEEKAAGKRDERQKRGRGVEEDCLLRRVNQPCRASNLNPSPLLLHELAQMSDASDGTLLGFRQAALVDVGRTAGNASACLFGIQPNDNGACSTPTLELDSCNSSPLPYGWEKCLDLQTGTIYYLNRCTGLTTFSDPRAAPPPPFKESCSHALNKAWPPPPTSPSSASSEVTFEGGVARPPSCNGEGAGRQRLVPALSSSSTPPNDCQHPHLDLSLTLRPYSALPNRQSPESCRVSRVNIASSPKASACLGHPSTPVNRSSAGLSTSDSSKLSCYKQMSDVSRSAGMSSIPAGAERTAQSASAHLRLLDQQWPNQAAKATNFSMKGVYGEDHSKEDSSLLSCMITGGCANCLMFVMVPRTSSPKCPRCGTYIDVNAPTISSDRFVSCLSQPSPKKAKLLLPASLSVKAPRPTLEPAFSLL